MEQGKPKANSFRIGQQKVIHTFRGVRGDPPKYVIGDCGITVKLVKAFPETIEMRIVNGRAMTKLSKDLILCGKCHKRAANRLRASQEATRPYRIVAPVTAKREVKKLQFNMTTDNATATHHIYKSEKDGNGLVSSFCNCSTCHDYEIDLDKTHDEIEDTIERLGWKICKTCLRMAEDASEKYEMEQKNAEKTVSERG